MAIGSGQFTVTSTPAALFDADHDGCMVVVSNSGNKTAYLGNGDVSVSTGFILGKSEQITLDLGPNEVISAVCSPGDTTTISFIASKNQ
jgi:hypothetical protein